MRYNMKKLKTVLLVVFVVFAIACFFVGCGEAGGKAPLPDNTPTVDPVYPEKPDENNENAPKITVANREITVQPDSEFILNKTNLGITVTDDKTVEPSVFYSVEHNTVRTVLEEGQSFDAEMYGIYIVDVIAKDEDENIATERVLIKVDGTYVTDFDKKVLITGNYVASNTSGISLVTFNGGKAISFTPTNWNVAFNFPMENYDESIKAGDEIRVCMDLYLKGAFNDDGWLIAFEADPNFQDYQSYNAYTTFSLSRIYTDQRKAHLEFTTRAVEAENVLRLTGFRFVCNVDLCPDMQVYIDNILIINDKITYDWTYSDTKCDGRDVLATYGAVAVEDEKLKLNVSSTQTCIRFYNKNVLEQYSAGTKVNFGFDLKINHSNTEKSVLLAYLDGNGNETVISTINGSEYRVDINTVVLSTRGGYVNSTIYGSGLSNIMLYFVGTDDGDVLEFDNVSVSHFREDFVTIDGDTQFKLTAENLGLLSVSDNEPLTHTVTYNGVDPITLTDNAFTSESSGYYEVITTVTATGKEYYTLLVVEGSFVYGFNHTKALAGIWICNGSQGALWVSENGNNAWKLVPDQNDVVATQFNIPAINYDVAAQGERVVVSFIVKVKGSFISAAGWGTVYFESDSIDTTLISQELVSGTNLEDGVYVVTLETTLAYDEGVKGYRISGFKCTTYGDEINPEDSVALYIDNIYITKK